MQINPQELQGMEVEQLREVAALHEIKVHHKAGKPSIIAAILEHVAPNPNQQGIKSSEPEKPKGFHNTPDEVNAKIKDSLAREGFEAKYDLDENTWTFTFRKHSECGNLDIPMKEIVKASERVVRAANMKARAFAQDAGFDGNVGKRYANNVLM